MIGVNGRVCERECYRIESGVNQGSIIFPWFFNVHMNAVMKEVKLWMGMMMRYFWRRRENGDCLASLCR